MVKAVWYGEVIAESDATIVVENNHYFPRSAVREEFLTPSDHQSHCFWKGLASYFSLKVGDAENPDAAWYYPDPLPDAANIKDYVAFWKGVEVS